MIKFHGSNKDRDVIGIGLSRLNCDKLIAGKPIHLSGIDFGIAMPLEIVLFGGETEAGMVEELKRMGVLKDTSIIEEEGLDDPN